MKNNVKGQVQQFWNAHPCGGKFAKTPVGSKEFFEQVERFRYSSDWHIPAMVDFPAWRGKRVLEIGCGLGTDAVQFSTYGAFYTGIDLSPCSVELAESRFRQRNLKGSFIVSDAERLPFADETFDLVYSHGVLHHTPDTQLAVHEVYRVLKKGCTAMVMLYNKNSYNYYGNIMFFRRLGARLLAFHAARALTARLTRESLESLEQRRRQMKYHAAEFWQRERFLSENTDGAGNPLSKVFTRAEARRMFGGFSTVRTALRFLNKKWFPLGGPYLPRFIEDILARQWGWHLWIFAEK